MNKVNEVLEALKKNDWQYINDHHGRIETAEGVGICTSGIGIYPCLIFHENTEYVYYSINALYVSAGQVHLSTCSVSGVVVDGDIQHMNDTLTFGGGVSKVFWSDGTESIYTTREIAV